MTLPEEFEMLLKEVVNAKRLSASKMANLTDIAMKNMEHDTQLVSVLYRTHKSLSTTAAKVSSLYIFDALSRATKHHATKHGLSGDAFTQPGNSASFLFKAGGVVEGLFQDMIASGPEAKEKTRKILDIWVKGNTFPSTILSRLSDILKGTEKVPNSKADTTTADPRIPTQTSYSPPTPVAHVNPQATLLALLTQVAASTTGIASPTPPVQTVTNIGSPPPQLDAAQLAVIQQLAHTAASVPSVSQLPPPEFVNVQKFPSSSGVNGSSHTLPHFRNEPRTMVKSEEKYSGYRSPESESRPDPHFDERDNMRGRYRGGYRNRGRGDKFQGRNWDVRDRDRYRDSDRDQSPPHTSRGGRSRSRSPPSRYGGRRDPHYYSPPRRPHVASQYSGQRDTSVKRENESGKDEFGRDIRTASPTTSHPEVAEAKSPPPKPTLPHSPPPISPRSPLAPTSNPDSNSQKPVSPLVNANTSSNEPSALVITNLSMGLGMENFNLSTFDYTSPASWEALGKMWQVTHGYLPTTQQLMEFVISSGTGQSNPTAEITNHTFESSHGPSNRGRGRGRGGFYRGRGGTTHGNGRSMQDSDRDFDYTSQATDAIVLGGEPQLENIPQTTVNSAQSMEAQEDQSASNSSSGRMQRVGDKWMFVRGVAMDVS
ncbi:hypothetical protein GALMADRAFT_241098 [Galerina marginata CBS 339.88]|uniref:CID domain-containing protein n=1 Tax=Galerina marginata (strain CBS 339.88) TaxID=685588 RepID=A0A067TNZ6_GALM3|nr:hypothetical protein GALMADRAFT_241098 [Galerina marginata CBS 339.88]